MKLKLQCRLTNAGGALARGIIYQVMAGGILVAPPLAHLIATQPITEWRNKRHAWPSTGH